MQNEHYQFRKTKENLFKRSNNRMFNTLVYFWTNNNIHKS